jgi:hypothetical protein
MTASIDHVLLTRFNLPSEGAERLIRAKEGWLRNRVELFEAYCLPSVLAQSNRNFQWIIYLDPESPEWLKDRMAKLNSQSVFTLIYRARVSAEERTQDLKCVTGAQRDVLITTNLDNDDGLAVDFVERLQALRPGTDRTAIYFTHGLIRQGPLLYLNKDPNNAFCSVRETWQAPVSCWADWHNRLGRSMPVLNVLGSPAWLQVVHGTNVSNRIRGVRIAPEPFAPGFGALLDGTEGPDTRAAIRERLLELPCRVLREGGRAIAKSLVLGMLGKEGLDRLKAGRESFTKISAHDG